MCVEKCLQWRGETEILYCYHIKSVSDKMLVLHKSSVASECLCIVHTDDCNGREQRIQNRWGNFTFCAVFPVCSANRHECGHFYCFEMLSAGPFWPSNWHQLWCGQKWFIALYVYSLNLEAAYSDVQMDKKIKWRLEKKNPQNCGLTKEVTRMNTSILNPSLIHLL